MKNKMLKVGGNVAQVDQAELEAAIKAAANSEESMGMAEKMISELRDDLIGAFKRLAVEYNTTEEKIQLGICFKDIVEKETGKQTGNGQMYYQLFVNWAPVREANFNRDILGIQGKAALYPDSTGKEAFIKVYVTGFPQLKIDGLFLTLAQKHNVQQWSHMSGIFYKKNPEDQIKLGIFVKQGETSKRVELIDIFENLQTTAKN